MGSVVAERFGNLLRVNRFATGLVDREPVEILARLAVMFRRPVEMGAVALLADEREYSFNSRANVAHHAEIDRRAAADLFGPQIHLRDANPCAARIELAIGEIGAEHQENVAIEHGVVARGESDQPGHAHIKRVVPLDMLLAAERMHNGSFQAIGQREDLIMRAPASRRLGWALGPLPWEAARPRRAEGRCRPELPRPRRRDYPLPAGSRSPERGASGWPRRSARNNDCTP